MVYWEAPKIRHESPGFTLGLSHNLPWLSALVYLSAKWGRTLYLVWGWL